jgi:hypothetical protein
MGTKILETFQATLGACFDLVLKSMLGQRAGRGVYDLLEWKGIQRSEIPAKFEEAVSVLYQVFGTSARSLVHKTAVELYTEYSAWPNFTFYDSLTDQITRLRNTVVTEGFNPKHTLTIDQDVKPVRNRVT